MPRFRLKEKHGKHLYRSIQGTGRENQRLLRPGDIICCEEHELGSAMDKFEKLDPDQKSLQDTAQVKLKAIKIKKGKKDEGKYWVINENSGKKITKIPLDKETAMELVNYDSDDNPENMEE
jgi:hypothetical protein